jgi:hypothetical protein
VNSHISHTIRKQKYKESIAMNLPPGKPQIFVLSKQANAAKL